MKRIYFLFLLSVVIVSSMSAQHATYLPDRAPEINAGWLRLDIAVESGVLFGMLYEYVFIDFESDDKYDDMLSRLDWQLNPLFYAGVTVQAEMWEQLVVGLGFWLGVPLPLGYMEDRDWGNGGGYTGNLEIFSHHDNMLLNAVFADINAGYNLVKDSTLVFTPLIGFTIKHVLMSGRDGYQEQPPGTLVQTFDEELITYEQNYYICYIGAQVCWTPHPLLSLQLFCCYSPLVFAYNVDRHLHPSVAAEYLDLPEFGHYIHVNPVVFIHILKDVSIKAQGSLTYVPEFKGKIYTRPLSGGSFLYITDHKGGASMLAWGMNIACVVHLADIE
ncbi:MAG: omptin family outer membrane protease [Spirochaetales bacterium]|nr:omptin family outer membrane protease [Spirochaetales bacterium]